VISTNGSIVSLEGVTFRAESQPGSMDPATRPGPLRGASLASVKMPKVQRTAISFGVAALLLMALGLGGCGGGEDASPTEPTRAERTTATTPRQAEPPDATRTPDAQPRPRSKNGREGRELLPIPPGGHRTLRVQGGGRSAAEARRIIHQLLHEKPKKSGGSRTLRNPRQVLRELLEEGKRKKQSGGPSEKQGEGSVSAILEQVLKGR
jgi:hypothetical protein